MQYDLVFTDLLATAAVRAGLFIIRNSSLQATQPQWAVSREIATNLKPDSLEMSASFKVFARGNLSLL
jgi:hypothetical protein